MATFDKWGFKWRKKFQWGQAFNQNGNCLFATDEMVLQDQDDSVPLELHLMPICPIYQKSNYTRVMIKFLIIIVSTLPLGNIYAQLSNSQNLTTPYGQTAFSIPKGSCLYQNILVIGNQIHYGIGKSTSIGLSMFPTSLNSDQLQIIGALSPNYAIGINSKESFKIGAFVSFGFAPKTGGLSELGGLYLLYSRCLSRNDMITIGYSYMGSTTNFPPWSNLITVNYKHSIINSKVGLEIDGIYRWSEENWGMPEWGTIWNDKNLLFTAIISLRFKQNDHIALGLTNSYHYSWTPILGASENSLLFPFLGYSCLIGAD